MSRENLVVWFCNRPWSDVIVIVTQSFDCSLLN